MTGNIDFYNNNLLNILNGGSITNNPLQFYLQKKIIFEETEIINLNNVDFNSNKQILDIDISNKYDNNCQSFDGYIYTFSKKITNDDYFSNNTDHNDHNIYILKIYVKTKKICNALCIFNKKICNCTIYKMFSLKIVKYKDSENNIFEKLYYTKPDNSNYTCINCIDLKTFTINSEKITKYQISPYCNNLTLIQSHDKLLFQGIRNASYVLIVVDLETNKEIDCIDCQTFSRFIYDVLYNNVYVVVNDILKKYTIFKDKPTEKVKYLCVHKKKIHTGVSKIIVYGNYLFTLTDATLTKYCENTFDTIANINIRNASNCIIFNNYIYITINNCIKKYNLDLMLIIKHSDSDCIYKNIFTNNSTNIYYFTHNKLKTLNQIPEE